MGQAVPNPHDALFRRVFSRPEHAAAELRHVVQARVVDALDWSTIQASDTSFVDAHLEESQADLLFSVRVRGRDAIVYLLLEHKSRSDPFTALQLLVYCVRIWQRWREQNPGAKKLPAIIPVVVHHSDSGWTAARSLRESLDLAPEILEVLAKDLPGLGFLLDDLSQASGSDLQTRAVAAVVRFILFCLQRARHSRDFRAECRPWYDVIEAAAEEAWSERGPDAPSALTSVPWYLLAASSMTPADVRTFARELGPKAQEAFMSGLKQLLDEGRAEGRIEGRVEVLLRLLSVRFGVLPPDVVQRLRTASIDDLDAWAERLLQARSLAEVFAPG